VNVQQSAQNGRLKDKKFENLSGAKMKKPGPACGVGLFAFHFFTNFPWKFSRKGFVADLQQTTQSIHRKIPIHRCER